MLVVSLRARIHREGMRGRKVMHRRYDERAVGKMGHATIFKGNQRANSGTKVAGTQFGECKWMVTKQMSGRCVAAVQEPVVRDQGCCRPVWWHRSSHVECDENVEMAAPRCTGGRVEMWKCGCHEHSNVLVPTTA